jgi:hypothetical protein
MIVNVVNNEMLICGYRADCSCELDNGVCWTCKFGGKRINNKIVDNYCNQTLENLQIIKNKLILKPSRKNKRLSIIHSKFPNKTI